MSAPNAVLAALHAGDIDGALAAVREGGAAALAGLSILEDVFPLALTTLADAYDKAGITGNERPYFDLSRELWQLMSPEERDIPDMLATFVYAGW